MAWGIIFRSPDSVSKDSYIVGVSGVSREFDLEDRNRIFNILHFITS
jgi:hypothetical protein